MKAPSKSSMKHCLGLAPTDSLHHLTSSCRRTESCFFDARRTSSLVSAGRLRLPIAKSIHDGKPSLDVRVRHVTSSPSCHGYASTKAIHDKETLGHIQGMDL